jgi:F0F1-type ATP synthase membrane subunit b/b'
MDGVPMILAPVPGYMPTQPDRLLNMPRVATDLQLLPEQKEKLEAKFQELRDEFARRRDRINHQLSTEIPEQERERLNQQLAELQSRFREDIKAAIDEVLLPFQKKRLDQLVAQSRLNNDGSGALENEEFARLLQLTEEQKKALQQQQEEMQKKLQEEIVALRRKRQRELLESVLDKDQLKRLKDLIGDDLGPEEKGTQLFSGR